jgi:hypothetical protein
MRRTRKHRKRHAASRARKLTAVLSVSAFVAIGQAINLAAPTASTAQTGTVAQSAASHATLLSASKPSVTASAAPRTTKAVTTTHAG